MKYTIIVVCVLIATWSAGLLTLDVIRERAGFWESTLHLGVVLLMVSVIFRERFLTPAKQWVLIVMDVLPGGRRKTDPPDPAAP